MRARFTTVEEQSNAALDFVHALGPTQPARAEFVDGTGASPGAIPIQIHVEDSLDAARLAKVVGKARRRAKRGAVFVVEIDGQVPMSAIVAQLEQLSALGTVRLVVITQLPPRVPMPTPEAPDWARDVMARVSADGGATVLGEAIATTLGGCEPLIATFDPRTFGDGGNRAGQILSRVPGAVEHCACRGIDVDALELLIIVTTMVFESARGWLEVRFNPAGEPVASPDDYAAFISAVEDVPSDRRLVGVRWISDDAP
jgi:hypothetical protein